MNIIEEVKIKYVYFLTQIPNKNKFYHLKSIQNFMLGFEEIGSMNVKYGIADILNKYFDYVNDHDVNSKTEGRYIFFTFIEPLGMIYKKKLKFSFLFSLNTIFIYFFLGILIMAIFKILMVYILGIIILGALIFYKIFLQRKSKKIFGFQW